jgi:hypothetical protein
VASAHEDIEGLFQKVTLLEGELAEVHRARETVEEMFRSLFDMSANGMLRLVVSEKERQEQFEELSLPWSQGSKLCLAIIDPPWVRNYLPEGMRAVALRYTEVVRELATLRAAVSSTTGLVLGCSADETFWVEVMDELVAEFWRLEELCSWLERPGSRICNLLLGPPLC